MPAIRLVMILCLAMAPRWAGAAAATPADIVIGQRQSIHSTVLGEDRVYSVYLPPSYGNPGAYTRYPVLYLLDGDVFFHSFSGTVNYMSSGINANTRFPEMIVVGIHNTSRDRDFTPTRSMKSPFGPENPAYATTGGLGNFQRFLATELMPHIDQTYRASGYRLFVGHSLAGLAVVHTFLTAPRLFDAYVALDPSTWWDNGVSLRTARESARTLDLTHKQLFIATANQQKLELYDAVDLFVPAIVRAIKMNRSPGLSVTHKHYEHEDHGTVPLPAFIDGIATIFDGHRIDHVTYYDHPERIDAQYDALSARLGTRLVPPEGVINYYGYWFLTTNGFKDMRKALIYFEMNARNFPESFNAWDSLAEGTLATGDRRLAATYYRKSLALNPANQNAKQMIDKIEAE